MKKAYMKPLMETVEINSDNALMAASETYEVKGKGTYSSTGEDAVDILSKQNSFDVFDMDEEEE